MKFAFNGLLAVLAVFDRAIGVLERLVIGATVLAMAFLMSAHVVGQLVFDQGIPGTYEVTEMLIVVMTFVGSATPPVTPATFVCPPFMNNCTAPPARGC